MSTTPPASDPVAAHHIRVRRLVRVQTVAHRTVKFAAIALVVAVVSPLPVTVLHVVVREENAFTTIAGYVSITLLVLTVPMLGLIIVAAVLSSIVSRLLAVPPAEECAALVRMDRDPWHTVVRVVRPTQYARTGTKALIQFRNGQQVAAWFPEMSVARNQVFAIQGKTGYGAHHHQTVFYVNSVTHQFSFQSWKRARRLR